jgi:hypothetical protein
VAAMRLFGIIESASHTVKPVFCWGRDILNQSQGLYTQTLKTDFAVDKAAGRVRSE